MPVGWGRHMRQAIPSQTKAGAGTRVSPLPLSAEVSLFHEATSSSRNRQDCTFSGFKALSDCPAPRTSVTVYTLNLKWITSPSRTT